MINYFVRNKHNVILGVYTVAICLLAWFVLSYIEVVSNNMTTCEYSRLNIFSMFF